jgi:hypothetical protein
MVMKEKQAPKPKAEKKPSKQAIKKPESKKNKQKANTTQPEVTIPKEEISNLPADHDLPTQEEIEDIKQDILKHGLLNPYAFILYNYMQASTYETNIQVVLTMRNSLLKIDKINRIILEELNEDDPE